MGIAEALCGPPPTVRLGVNFPEVSRFPPCRSKCLSLLHQDGGVIRPGTCEVGRAHTPHDQHPVTSSLHIPLKSGRPALPTRRLLSPGAGGGSGNASCTRSISTSGREGARETLIEQVGETLPCVLVLGAGQGPWQGAGTLRSLGPPTPQGMQSGTACQMPMLQVFTLLVTTHCINGTVSICL